MLVLRYVNSFISKSISPKRVVMMKYSPMIASPSGTVALKVVKAKPFPPGPTLVVEVAGG